MKFTTAYIYIAYVKLRVVIMNQQHTMQDAIFDNIDKNCLELNGGHERPSQ